MQIPYEVFGSFSLRFEEIKRVEINFLLERWNEAKGSVGMKRVFEQLRGGRYPGAFGLPLFSPALADPSSSSSTQASKTFGSVFLRVWSTCLRVEGVARRRRRG